jgi:hypothetical protein
LKEVKPEAVFRLFLTNSLLETITKHTNEDAATKRGENPAAGGRAWWYNTSEEVDVWIGIVLYMGVHQSPAIADYWKHDDQNPLHPIRHESDPFRADYQSLIAKQNHDLKKRAPAN